VLLSVIVVVAACARDETVSEPTILLDINKNVAKITLNRPEKLNAINEQMHAELAHAMDRIELDRKIRAVLITGAGRGFCSGQDLSERAIGAPFDAGNALERLYNPLIRRLRALERPIVGAVNGIAAGAGASLALCLDIVLAARSATFVEAFIRIGLLPDAGGTFFLPRQVGHARATGMAMLGESISAEQAADWGLIWRAVDDDRLMAEAEQLAAHLATQPTRAIGLIKRALNASSTNDLDQQLDLERDLQREAGHSEDFTEGVTAFLERRAATFKGR
jgi:2-(1,2-epoxy-1,2-dihydrophenyl)acetyl-CoA isomerase